MTLLKDTKDTTLILEEARRVLKIEHAGVLALSNALGDSFINAVHLIEKSKGRVAVTGIGKSGHIGRKIAATLASTGTPALFIHAAEASHGDLGMLTLNDVLLALSNSGETKELSDILIYGRRRSIPIISITQKPKSALAIASDIVLTLPNVEEACPNHLAPTTSSLMMLALGDALAMTLLKRKGFGPEDYKYLHPGGQLGRELLHVQELMHEKLPLAKLGTTMTEALITMTKYSFGCVGVVDQEGTLIGIITDGDLRRHMSQDLLEKKVDQIMHPNPKTIGAQKLAAEALKIMNEIAITSLFIVDQDHSPIGLIHIHDCLRAGIS